MKFSELQRVVDLIKPLVGVALDADKLDDIQTLSSFVAEGKIWLATDKPLGGECVKQLALAAERKGMSLEISATVVDGRANNVVTFTKVESSVVETKELEYLD
jgi:hypothetical protein